MWWRPHLTDLFCFFFLVIIGKPDAWLLVESSFLAGPCGEYSLCSFSLVECITEGLGSDESDMLTQLLRCKSSQEGVEG